MDKNVKQSHFSLYLQNRPLKYCLEGDNYTPSPQNCSGNRGLEGKISKGAKGLIAPISLEFMIEESHPCLSLSLGNAPLLGGERLNPKFLHSIYM